RYSCSERLTAEAVKEYLTAQPGVTAVGQVREYRLALTPNDTYYQEQRPYLEQVKAHEAWDKPTNTSASRPVIAILDTGVDIAHPDLAANIWFNPWEVPGDRIDQDQNGYVDDQYGWDFIANTTGGTPKLDAGWSELAVQHGTIVAGVAAAVGNNAQGVAGVAWRARLMPVRVLDSKGVGDTVTVARGIDYAVRNRADIINLSFVGPLSDPVLEDAIRRAYAAGILVVAAAGNEAAVGVDMNRLPQYPVCDDGPNGENFVIGVAAVDAQDRLAEFSNYGSRCIDISAPGVRVFSTQFVAEGEPKLSKPYGGYWSGTSVAAPVVSGALALLKAAYPTLSPSQLRDLLINSGDQIDAANQTVYRGQLGRRLNLRAAFDLAGSVKFPVKSPIVVAPLSGAAAQVTVYDLSGELIQQFLAYDPRYTKGVNVAAGDVDGDGQVEIVTAPRAGGGPHVRVFNLQGQLEYQFMALPENFRGGLSLAVGEITGDGVADIVLGVGPGGSNLVGVYNANGHRLHQFVPYEADYTGGVNVAVGDLDADGLNEVVVTPSGASKLPLRIYERTGVLRREFAAWPFAFRGGVNVAIGDTDGDGKAEIVVGAGMGGGPQVRVFNRDGKLLQQFFAYDAQFRGGVNVAAGDVDGDGVGELITTPGTGGGPHVRVFNQRGQVRSQFFVGDARSRGGLTVGTFR
ncbi:MAG: S8 family serine peptidase, partial [Candidatus Veblenbacteria bacterium]|nr:S8 family serine peptidase [Candidatus Veblenbacteria bacterium]